MGKETDALGVTLAPESILSILFKRLEHLSEKLELSYNYEGWGRSRSAKERHIEEARADMDELCTTILDISRTIDAYEAKHCPRLVDDRGDT